MADQPDTAASPPTIEVTDQQASVAASLAKEEAAAALITPPPPSAIVVPGVLTILKFSLSSLAILLSDPMLSMVDTIVVCSVDSVQLAALAPATQICDRIACVFALLAATTTNTHAKLQAGGQPLKNIGFCSQDNCGGGWVWVAGSNSATVAGTAK